MTRSRFGLGTDYLLVTLEWTFAPAGAGVGRERGVTRPGMGLSASFEFNGWR
jgi:hypothetical protein